MYPSLQKLNIFQKYTSIHIIAYVFILMLFAMYVFWIHLYTFNRFVNTAEKWLNTGKISKQQYDMYVEIIGSSPFVTTFAAVCIFVAILYILYRIFVWFYSQLFTSPVSLAQVYEFSEALRMIGRLDPNEYSYFIFKNKIPVYVASESLLSSIGTDVVVRLFPYDVCFLLPDSFIHNFIISKKLCIAKEDFDEIIKKYNKIFEINVHSEIEKYKDIVAECAIQRDKLEKEKSKLEENIEFLKSKITKESKKDTTAAIEGKLSTNDAAKFDYYRIAIPVVDSLNNHFRGQKYTRSDIQSALLRELDLQPQYKDAFCATAVDAEGNVRPWAVEALRKRLGDRAETEAGRPRKDTIHDV